jgi:hypothetical protein
MKCPKCGEENPDNALKCAACDYPFTKAPPPRPGIDPSRPQDPDYAKRYWERLDQLFYDTLKNAEMAYKVNLIINLIVVAVGISLLAYSMYYSWFNNLDIYSVGFGALGVVTFITTFFITTQKKIQRRVGDLTQIQIVYRSYCLFEEAVGDWERKHSDADMTLQNLDEINAQLSKMMASATNSIEQVVGED